ncbi:MAG: hypothetical protein NVS1B13_06790 [Flavisolibacter sp.]
MIRIHSISLRKNKEGKPFVTLNLQGDLVMIKSTLTGSYYASSKKCSVTSTFTEEIAAAHIGREISGKIERISCPAMTIPLKAER